MPSKSYTHSHQGLRKGPEYDASFSGHNYRQFVWNWEQKVIDQVLAEANSSRSVGSLLDFACGTGRVAAHVSGKVDAVYGVDVSESMLSVARLKAPLATLAEANILEGQYPREFPKEFDVITAFRFFLNADPQMRSEAIRALSTVLAADGRIVFNNHLNSRSLSWWGLRAYTSLRYLDPNLYCALSDAQIDELLSEAGLRIDRTYRFGVWPVHPREKTRVPLRIIDRFESTVGRLPFVNRLSTYSIYVAIHDQ